MKKAVNFVIKCAIEVALFPFLVIACLWCRNRKRIKIGFGPEPIISNIYLKKALEKRGFAFETFVSEVYYITDQFDIRGDLKVKSRFLRQFYLFLLTIKNYQGLYLFFRGGPLNSSCLLWKWEPFLYQLANVKIVVMPYGGDVQDLTRCPNLAFKHTLVSDYPNHRKLRKKISQSIDLWTQKASHVIGGCDWVDYLYHWDTLMLVHFTIQDPFPKKHSLVHERKNLKNLRILHAPNHRNIKGTKYFVEAVDNLKEKGFPIELIILERVSNEKVLEEIEKADMIADQLVIGWYAMFAMEAMLREKPVLCYLRQDLLDFYESADLITQDEIPIINCHSKNVKDKIAYWFHNREELSRLGKKSREFVLKHHSYETVGKQFEAINLKIGLKKAFEGVLVND